MTLGGFELCCPQCRGALAQGDTPDADIECTVCRRRYPVVAGIPDLRIHSDPYIDPAADRAKGAHLAERMNDLTFEELVHYYYSVTSVVPPKHARQYTQGLMWAVQRAENSLRGWQDLAGVELGGSLLDVGCGTAPLLVAARPNCDRAIGVDVAFRWLVVGKKRLAEAGVDVPLVCASVEALPFRPETFDVTVMDAVIEHVSDQPKALEECRRVLRNRGSLFVSTPNRTSLGPDPHTGLWAGGILPERAVAWYVRRLGGIPPHRHFLTRSSLVRLLGEAGFNGVNATVPAISDAQRAGLSGLKRALVDGYHFARRRPMLRSILFRIGPHLLATARK
ncbi:MAG TPA: methyltransferase domain-containing protein [Rhodothermales bacterium]